MFNELRPLAFRGKGHPRVSVAGQIDEVKIPVYTVEVDRLRPARCITGKRQPSFPCKCIDQTGFPDVASTQERYLGQPVGGELLGTAGTIDEFCYQFYYTGKVGGGKRAVNSSIACFQPASVSIARTSSGASTMPVLARSCFMCPASDVPVNGRIPIDCAKLKTI